MFGHEYGQNFYFHNVSLQKKAFHVCSTINLARLALLNRLSPSVLCSLCLQNRLVLTYVIRLFDDRIEFT